MDLLSAIGMATKRRADYFTQALALAKKYKTQEALEKRMAEEAKVVVKGLKDKQMRWEEYERTLLDKTLTSALASVYLGAADSSPKEKMVKAWGSIVGDMMPPLIAFLDETKSYIDQGLLRLGDDTVDFSDWDKYFDDDFESQDELNDVLTDPGDPGKNQIQNPSVHAAAVADSPGGKGRTWKGLLNRVINYLATPTFGFWQLGRFMRKQEQGFKEMKRVARKDKKTCVDCKGYDAQGWQPIGTLPMPGHGCRCYANCRCHIEYR
jgi:hypothetical protein